MTSVNRISPQHLFSAINKVRSMSLVIREFTLWLMELAELSAEPESDEFVMMAGINIVNCIAHAEVQNVLN